MWALSVAGSCERVPTMIDPRPHQRGLLCKRGHSAKEPFGLAAVGIAVPTGFEDCPAPPVFRSSCPVSRGIGNRLTVTAVRRFLFWVG
jgi:hypothetical protein